MKRLLGFALSSLAYLCGGTASAQDAVTVTAAATSSRSTAATCTSRTCNAVRAMRFLGTGATGTIGS